MQCHVRLPDVALVVLNSTVFSHIRTTTTTNNNNPICKAPECQKTSVAQLSEGAQKETAIFEVAVKILTSYLHSATDFVTDRNNLATGRRFQVFFHYAKRIKLPYFYLQSI